MTKASKNCPPSPNLFLQDLESRFKDEEMETVGSVLHTESCPVQTCLCLSFCHTPDNSDYITESTEASGSPSLCHIGIQIGGICFTETHPAELGLLKL